MTDKPLNILVTGAGGGMCVGINERLAAAGHTVLCADLNLDAAAEAAGRIRDAGGRALAFELNVTSDDSISALHAAVQEQVGPIQALVNAAGILDRKYLADHDTLSFQFALDINLTGPFRLIREFGPELVEQGFGRIINISSIAGVTGYHYPSYAASKAGLSNLTRSLLVDFWGTGVTVNNICPGVVDTPMVIQEVRDQVKKKVPTEKIVTPEEIGALAVFLLTEDARSINGADLLIDGGATQVFSLFDR
ncbi:SDR family NAD(P)-dependent oxidoreductase [Corynebacterium sp.]|uniref:SDR family NAD(P)-dependent oxidoreductase n=1 Tax=Corynebacterium sp. TaxID=1720 RepID=UPI0026DF5587|nr:SDR family oxidoreductase [Corynebacterium sp.]MDO5511745.1 SDR family oxidoreductase [Corynebacterium sp.]